MIVQIPDYHLYGRLEKTRDGVMVLLCRSDRPRGARLLMREHVSAPIGTVAENLRAILTQAAELEINAEDAR